MKWTPNTNQNTKKYNLIGRGNFGKPPHLNSSCIGAAYLVKNKAEGKEYIAKKILVGSM